MIATWADAGTRKGTLGLGRGLPTSAAESPCLLSMGMKAAFLLGRDGLDLS